MQTEEKGAPSRPVLAALLSALIPGAGQLYAGHRKRALVIFAIDVVLIAFAVMAFVNKLEVVKAAFRPGALVGAMLGNILLFGFRLWAADDAYLLAAERGIGRLRVASAVVIGILLAGPHFVLGYYDLVHYDTITSIFASDEVTTTTTTTPPTTLASDVTGTTDPVETTQPPETSAPDPVLWDGLERLNIALLGGDSGVGRRGIRTDTMIVVSIDPETGNVVLFGLPRNIVQTPLPVEMGIWGCDCFPFLLNELYAYGVRTPDAFPGPQEPPLNAIKGGFGETLGIPIHYYALVSLDGFVGVIDAIGGVTIDVPYTVIDETYPHEDGVTTEYLEIEAGEQHLDGHLALGYVRARRNASDYARMGRQRCLLDAMMAEADPVSLALSYPTLAGVLEETVETDIPLSRLPDLIDLLPRIDQENMISLRFIPPDYLAGFDENGQNMPRIDLIQEHVQVVINNTPEDAREILEIASIDESC